MATEIDTITAMEKNAADVRRRAEEANKVLTRLGGPAVDRKPFFEAREAARQEMANQRLLGSNQP